ncbi:Protein FAR1-related sequence 5 [Vitis vinifera]|uniref:Protein FAR1-related sequence 5 n=1 Tax=Vitis vinifera TaxID=29760 RepID=A0A438I718_VITVI|nr:Protein FAR1-related sequence 5 [Vitis vinifera]RVW92511.1 Protein FAR1-related sequence 5 [Vitis vinifera]
MCKVSKRGYELSKTGYKLFKRVYELSKRGYELSQTGYKLSKIGSRYELSKSGYELSKRGYELSKRGYELSKTGYELSKTGYELSKRVYELSKKGYELCKRWYGLSNTGYELSKTGYELSKRGYELSKRGYELSKRGYELCKRGYELSKRGYELSKTGYEVSKRGYELWYELSKKLYELSKRGYELSDTGYQLSKTGYELSKKGYGLCKIGYELSKTGFFKDTMDKGKGNEFIIDLNDEDFDYQYDSIIKTECNEEVILVSENIFNDLTVEDVWKMKFSLVDEAEEFYNLFAKVVGFSVRKDDVKRDKNQNIVSHKAQLNAIRGVGLGTSQIIDYIVQQSSGYNNVGFTKKNLYNHVDADRRVHLRDGDTEGALSYLCGKSEMDPSFYYKYNVNEDNRLANLFWADSTSKLDYSCFGDVLAFDTTYQTNAYKKPLVILVGINHHHQTIVFGCALFVDESVSTYNWVLETFLDAMNNKKPLYVITDGDKAMRKAIKRIFPDSCHRLCAWHIQRNAFTNVHVKDFTNHFSKCMFMEGTVEEY